MKQLVDSTLIVGVAVGCGIMKMGIVMELTQIETAYSLESDPELRVILENENAMKDQEYVVSFLSSLCRSRRAGRSEDIVQALCESFAVVLTWSKYQSTSPLHSNALGKLFDRKVKVGAFRFILTDFDPAEFFLSQMTLAQLESVEDFKKFISNWRLAVVHFYASWAPPCDQVNKMLANLKEDYKSYSIGVAFIDAEAVPEVSAMCSISAAPTLVYFLDGKEVDRVDGYKPAETEMKLTKYSFDIAAAPRQASERATMPTPSSKEVTATVPSSKEHREDLNSRLKKLIESNRLMLFMKGSPDNPQCGFSKQIVELLNDVDASFGSFDILQDEEVRQGLKTYSNWPTFPQLYLDGELIGGLDVFREELHDDEFVAKLPKRQDSDLYLRLKSLINSHKLMLFMKGDRQQPMCKFSRQIIDLLDGVEADYSTFDILKDEEVRQGLKSFSNWPTYPQLYLNGELLGGLDVVKAEMSDENFVSSLPKKSHS
ncbi:hypothetical protein KIN20_016467 [Parelaphostrongylus tenuis]|uniref:Thioredoxin domain-containing protein n=1 Tax=Parelaphostrongylus tenuis TaxID=148309 RepID=A0AAD5MHF9_PARTN|nr:hypothetical protein KIN20_016467 [Parelaphostrongylus tenuis]